VGGRLLGRKVALVVAWPVLGGTERTVLRVANEIIREGAHVEIVALTDAEGRFRDEVRALRIPWHPVRVDWSGGRVAKTVQLALLASRLRSLRPDVVMAYSKQPNVLCGLVWRVTGASLFVWNQRDVIPWGSTRHALAARAARASPMHIANSRVAQAFLVRELGVRPERVHVVYNTAELAPPAASRAEWRARLGISEQTLVVTMLAHLTHRKDHPTLLRAWRNVVESYSGPTVLLVAGRAAGAEQEAKAVAFDHGLDATKVRFLGDVEDVAGLLQATDLSVLCSKSEAYPNAVLESMVAGLPVAGTDLPGIREVIGPHQLRFLAPPGDAETLARALLELLESRGLRENVGSESARLVLERNGEGAATCMVDIIVEALTRRAREVDSIGTSAPAKT